MWLMSAADNGHEWFPRSRTGVDVMRKSVFTVGNLLLFAGCLGLFSGTLGLAQPPMPCNGEQCVYGDAVYGSRIGVRTCRWYIRNQGMKLANSTGAGPSDYFKCTQTPVNEERVIPPDEVYMACSNIDCGNATKSLATQGSTTATGWTVTFQTYCANSVLVYGSQPNPPCAN